MYLRCALAVLFWGPKLPKATHPRELRICPICLSFALHAAVLHFHCCCTDAQNADKSVEKQQVGFNNHAFVFRLVSHISISQVALDKAEAPVLSA